jgi:hypothetical protein
MTRTTHTFAILEISPVAYIEIRRALVAAGYTHAILGEQEAEVIDMHGIAVRESPNVDRARPARGPGW